MSIVKTGSFVLSLVGLPLARIFTTEDAVVGDVYKSRTYLTPSKKSSITKPLLIILKTF